VIGQAPDGQPWFWAIEYAPRDLAKHFSLPDSLRPVWFPAHPARPPAPKSGPAAAREQAYSGFHDLSSADPAITEVRPCHRKGGVPFWRL
jgi:hypothetical protein